MATRIELAKQFIDYQLEQKVDDLVAMLSDDVTMSSPMSGAISGKDALAEQIRNMPMGSDGPMGNITWLDPEADGEGVKVLGKGSPMGTLKITLGFNDGDEVNKIEMGLA